MKKWKFGIVGAGLIADFHARALAELHNAQVAGFCDAGSGRAAKLAQKYNARAFADFHAMAQSPDVDILSIATPSGLHAEPAIAAANAGKHAIVEKPLEITLQRIDMMIDAHQESGTLLGGIFQNRFDDCVKPLREAIDCGRFGTITFAGVFVPWWRPDDYYKDSWHGTWKLDGGGALMNQSIHMIDMLASLMPPIESVTAFAAHPGHPHIEAEDTAVAALRFSNGALGLIYGTTASYPGRPKRLEITGTKGAVIYLENSFALWQFADERSDDAHIRARFGPSLKKGGASDPGAIDYENHKRNFAAFLKALETGGDFEVSAKEARKSVEIVLAAYQSAKTRKVVRIG